MEILDGLGHFLGADVVDRVSRSLGTGERMTGDVKTFPEMC